MNEKSINPMFIDLSLNPCDFMPKKLFDDKRLKPLAKLFLMRLISLQVSGYKPFLSQKEFAEQQGVSRPTVLSAVNSLIDAGILHKERQREENLACEFYVNPDYMKSLGYEYRQRKETTDLEELMRQKAELESKIAALQQSQPEQAKPEVQETSLESIFNTTKRTSYRKADFVPAFSDSPF